MIRQKRYICQDFMDIEIFNIPNRCKTYKREVRKYESTEAQKNLNTKKAQRYVVRLVHRNFGRNDLFVDLTYDKENIPQARKEVLKDIKNYVASLRRWRKKHGLPALKYFYVISNMDQNGNKVRYHVHMIINDMDRDVAEQKWKKGYANTDRLQFNEAGVTGKVIYMARQAKGERSWGSSINLIKPEARISDKKITKKIKEKMMSNPEDRAYFEKIYPGWVFTDCTIENDDGRMTGEGLYIRMRRYNGKQLK